MGCALALTGHWDSAKAQRFQCDKEMRMVCKRVPWSSMAVSPRFLERAPGTRLTASTRPFRDGVLSIRASKTSSDSFRTYSSTAPVGGRGRKRNREDAVHSGAK